MTTEEFKEDLLKEHRRDNTNYSNPGVDPTLLEMKINTLRCTPQHIMEAAKTKVGACVTSAYNRGLDDAINVIREMANG